MKYIGLGTLAIGAVICMLLFTHGHGPNRTAPPRMQASGLADSFDTCVDPRVELLTIAWRAAGLPRLANVPDNTYTRAVDERFGRHRKHPALKILRGFHQAAIIDYASVMTLAVHLNADSLQLTTPLDPFPSTLGDCWQNVNIPAFLEHLCDFANQARFREFFDAHRDLYEKAADEVKRSLSGQLRLEWFDAFFGNTLPVRHHVILGMLNGSGSFGPHVDRSDGRDAYCIIGIWKTDAEGVPYQPGNANLLVHEFGHSYTNPIVAQRLGEFAVAGEKIQATCRDVMARQGYGAYGWHALVYESVVRACGVRYVDTCDGAAAGRRWREYEASRGFLWVPALADLLGEYEQQRDRYPTLDSFMPHIAEFFERYAEQHAKPAAALAQPPTTSRLAE